jgi:hypothetical protein
MVGAETPLPPNPGEPVPSVPPSTTGAWGPQRLIYFVLSLLPPY